MQTLDGITSTPAVTNACPSFPSQVGFARVSVLYGVAIVSWGTVASELTGLRIEAGQSRDLAIGSGQTLAFVEAVDGPSGTSTPSTYVETTVAMTGSWVLAAPANTSRRKLILGDAAGQGMSWSLSSSPVAGEGVVFSLPGAPGSYVFDSPQPNGAVYAKGPAGAVLTVVAA